jgi:hypothetical protein
MWIWPGQSLHLLKKLPNLDPHRWHSCAETRRGTLSLLRFRRRQPAYSPELSPLAIHHNYPVLIFTSLRSICNSAVTSTPQEYEQDYVRVSAWNRDPARNPNQFLQRLRMSSDISGAKSRRENLNRRSIPEVVTG